MNQTSPTSRPRWFPNGAAPLILSALLLASPARAFIINVTYDSSVTSSANSAAIQSAFGWAVQTFENQFANATSVNITVYWGAVGPFAGGINLGASSTAEVDTTYADIKAALQNARSSAADYSSVASLPASDPLPGVQWWISQAEAKVLGLIPIDSTDDGDVGFADNVTYTFNPTNRAVPLEFDFISVAEHEISEVLGRGYGLDYPPGNGYLPYDLFRFTGNGTRNFDPFGTSVYFSVDDGATVLKYFYPDITTGDAQDWASGATPDSYDAYLYDGLQGDLTTNDLMALDVLGYNSPGVKAAHVTGTALTKSSFQISFTNLAATSYAILATTNLTLPTTSWTVLGTAIENPVGQYAFTDPYATNRLRFYRVRSP